MMLLCAYMITLVLSTWFTGLIRKYSLANNLLDIPNARSSHNESIPLGGGLAFVSIFLTSLLICCFYKLINPGQALVYLIAGLAIATIGFIDDRKPLSARWRLISHFLVAAYAIYSIANPPALTIFNWVLTPAMLKLLGVIYLVWLLNLFNFMDGIDGLAASEASTVCLGASIIYCAQGLCASIYLPLSLAMASAGFLVWNFPPAKIFMGDMGSCFLGIIIGLFSWYGFIVNEQIFWSWLILLGVFIVDASITLIRRIITGQAFWLAHCSHAYQQAAKYYNSHRLITMAVLAINLCWLFPLAFLVGVEKLNPGVGVVVAYLPLVILVFKFNAGKA